MEQKLSTEGLVVYKRRLIEFSTSERTVFIAYRLQQVHPYSIEGQILSRKNKLEMILNK